MADFVGTLVDMGFDRSKAQKAVEATGNSTVEAAMEWILSNEDKPARDSSETAMDTDASTPASNGDSKESDPAEVVRSYKCNQCQKLLRNVDEMELHATKTQHSDFQESTEEKKPLTEEEKKEQLRLIEEKLKIKRAEREAREKQDNLEREKNRMKSGKELAEYKRQAEEREMKELVEARRREKIDNQKARARVKAQIEADRQARKAKDAGIVAPEPSSGSSSISSLPSGNAASKLTQDEPPSKKDYTETKLQIRLPSGKAMVKAFNSKESLAAVRLYVQLNRDDGLDSDTPFNFMISFPKKKTFEDFEYDMPLDALGLVPSAVLIVTKSV